MKLGIYNTSWNAEFHFISHEIWDLIMQEQHSLVKQTTI